MKELWTDGSAMPNPGVGGFAVIERGVPVALGRENPSTNIRMEGLALIAAMEYAGDEECKIYTDSQFWVNVVTKWAEGWKQRGWRKSSEGEIVNLDIVKRLYELYERGGVELVWVRGHMGTEMNELADEWANRARRGMTVERAKAQEIFEEGETEGCAVKEEDEKAGCGCGCGNCKCAVGKCGCGKKGGTE